MITYRYKTIHNAGTMLDYDLDNLGAKGWKLVNFCPLYRKIPGSLGSEKGLSPDQTQTYIYIFVREIVPDVPEHIERAIERTMNEGRKA
jgi:hypothetical protein